MADLLTTLEHKVLLFDGAMGTQIQGRDLSVEEDFWGNENCSEILNLSRPDLVRAPGTRESITEGLVPAQRRRGICDARASFSPPAALAVPTSTWTKATCGRPVAR